MFEANSSVTKQERAIRESGGASKAKRDLGSVEYREEIHVTSK